MGPWCLTRHLSPVPADGKDNALLTILLIDDDLDYLALMTIALTDCGFRVVAASSAEEALFELSRHAIDAAVTDIRLPGLDGCALIGELRRRSAMPIVAVSGADEEGEAAARRAGADDYLAKPAAVDQLAATLTALAVGATSGRAKELRVGELTVHLSDGSVELGHRPIILSELEARLLTILVTPPLQVHSRNKLHEHLFGSESVDLTRVDRCIARLRAAFELDPSRPQHIVEVLESGFRYAA